MKFFLFIAIVFISHFALADGCRVAQIPWNSNVRAVGYGECRGYNFNQSACIKPPVQEDAMNMASEVLNQSLVSCYISCELSGGKLAYTANPSDCELVKGQSSVFDYYKCTLTGAVVCNSL